MVNIIAMKYELESQNFVQYVGVKQNNSVIQIHQSVLFYYMHT